MRWLARGEPSVPDGWDWLSEVEARRARSMRFTKRRSEYLLRRYAGKCGVAAALGLGEDRASLARIAVLNAPTGAPFVQVDGERVGMDVSLTDRAGWAVCLVGADLGAVGCDLEIVEPRSEPFVRDFLTEAEQASVAAATELGGDARDAAANLVWSAKESALKVLRTGLRADTRTVEVQLGEPGSLGLAGPSGPGAGSWAPLCVVTPIGDLPGWWRREGPFLLTVVTGAATGPGLPEPAPPVELPGSAALAAAQPMHTWLHRPLAP